MCRWRAAAAVGVPADHGWLQQCCCCCCWLMHLESILEARKTRRSWHRGSNQNETWLRSESVVLGGDLFASGFPQNASRLNAARNGSGREMRRRRRGVRGRYHGRIPGDLFSGYTGGVPGTRFVPGCGHSAHRSGRAFLWGRQVRVVSGSRKHNP